MSDTPSSHGTEGPTSMPVRPSVGGAIEGGIIKLGNIVSFLILLIMFLTAYEVTARYLFNSPTSWAWSVNRQLFAIFALVGGAYTMAHGMHIRIEMLQERFGPGMKLLVRCLSLACLFGFLGVLIWQGVSLGWTSFANREIMPGVFRMPLYPVKLFLPLATLLFLIEGVVCFFQKKL
jgi:TRAP-type mannitol/chloroaromatic compound transport system permease small subunit